ncbi:MAG TPA: hypothetical protein DEP87_04010 [Candidatus Pacebacteria bacterium]|nr:hypothetical protein [Candidatus Paceibacterota bacterium]
MPAPSPVSTSAPASGSVSGVARPTPPITGGVPPAAAITSAPQTVFTQPPPAPALTNTTNTTNTTKTATGSNLPPPTLQTGVMPFPKATMAVPLPAGTVKPGMPTVQIKPAPVPSTNLPLTTPSSTHPSSTPTPVGTQFGAQSPKPAGAKPTPLKAEIKKPPFWLFAVAGVVLLGLIGYLLFGAFGRSKPTSSTTGSKTDSATTKTSTGTQKTPVKVTTLTYWGLWEPAEVMTEVLKEFEAANPEYKVDYRKQSPQDYRERLQTAITSGNGPDLFRFHASWVPMLQSDLASLPSTTMTVADFKKTFYPVAETQLTLNGKILGVPLMYDGLALYYNKEMLQAAGALPPQTWAELKTLADSLTVPSDKAERSRGTLQRAGLAIGNATNVEHFGDIFGLLVLQNGGDLASPNSNEVRDALLFYTNFVKEDKVWSDAMPSSTVAFARGDVAMMFAPSWRALEIKAMNPSLDFGVASVPKLGEQRLGWATYWAEGVNSKSKNQEGAWALIKFLVQKENLEKFYTAASQTRAFGEPYSRQDLASSLAADPVLASILADAPTAESWYLNTKTHDNGLNDQLLRYYGDAINATLDGTDIATTLTQLNTGVTQVLRQYQVSQAPVSGI